MATYECSLGTVEIVWTPVGADAMKELTLASLIAYHNTGGT